MGHSLNKIRRKRNSNRCSHPLSTTISSCRARRILTIISRGVLRPPTRNTKLLMKMTSVRTLATILSSKWASTTPKSPQKVRSDATMPSAKTLPRLGWFRVLFTTSGNMAWTFMIQMSVRSTTQTTSLRTRDTSMTKSNKSLLSSRLRLTRRSSRILPATSLSPDLVAKRSTWIPTQTSLMRVTTIVMTCRNRMWINHNEEITNKGLQFSSRNLLTKIWAISLRSAKRMLRIREVVTNTKVRRQELVKIRCTVITSKKSMVIRETLLDSSNLIGPKEIPGKTMRSNIGERDSTSFFEY